MNYVYSTATNSIDYVKYKPSESSVGHHQILKRITIKGGHGVATKHLMTPKGVVTQVSDEEMEFLLQDENFKRHCKNGFMSHEKKKVEPEKKAKNMAEKDGSAPLTPKDFEKGENDSEELRVYKSNPTMKAA